MVDDENSRVYLSNKLSKAKRNLTKLTSEIESKRKEIDGMESLKEAYENNPRLGDSDAVTDVFNLIFFIINIIFFNSYNFLICLNKFKESA